MWVDGGCLCVLVYSMQVSSERCDLPTTYLRTSKQTHPSLTSLPLTSPQVLEVHIEPGMKHEEKIRFAGMSDEQPNSEPGDILFVLQEKPVSFSSP